MYSKYWGNLKEIKFKNVGKNMSFNGFFCFVIIEKFKINV